MKKIWKLLYLSLGVLLISGCMDYQVNMDVNENKSVDFKMNMKIDLYDFATKLLVDGGMWQLVQEDMMNDNCSLSCPYDEYSQEYTDCINKCMEEASSSFTDKPTEEDIKKFLQSNTTENVIEEEMFSDEKIKQLQELGYEIGIDIDDENYIYNVYIAQHFDNIDNISSTDEVNFNLEELLNSEDGNIKNILFTKIDDNTYKANYTFKNDDNNYQLPENIDMSNLISFKYVVTLPYKSISNNANEVSNDGKTLTWDLIGENNDSIQFEFSFDKFNFLKLDDNTLKIISICLIFGGSLSLIITIIVAILNNKKSNN